MYPLNPPLAGPVYRHFSCSSVYAVYRLQYTVHCSALVSTSPLPILSANMSSLEIIRATNAAGKGTCHFATLPFLPGLPSIPLGPTAPGTPTKSSAALKYSQNTVNFKLLKVFQKFLVDPNITYLVTQEILVHPFHLEIHLPQVFRLIQEVL